MLVFLFRHGRIREAPFGLSFGRGCAGALLWPPNSRARAPLCPHIQFRLRHAMSSGPLSCPLPAAADSRKRVGRLRPDPDGKKALVLKLHWSFLICIARQHRGGAESLTGLDQPRETSDEQPRRKPGKTTLKPTSTANRLPRKRAPETALLIARPPNSKAACVSARLARHAGAKPHRSVPRMPTNLVRFGCRAEWFCRLPLNGHRQRESE